MTISEPLTSRLDVFKPRYRFRSAATGRYVSRAFALLWPRETVREKIMIPFLTPFMARLIGPRFATAATWLLLGVIAVIAFNIWLSGREKAAVQADRDKANVETVKVTTEARDDADAAGAVRTDQFEKQQTKDEKDIQDAKDNDRSPLDALFD